MTKDKGGENMPMNSYQYGTSPRKYEPDYTEVKVKKVKIIANELNVNNIIGHKKENIIKLKDTYDVDVTIERNDKIKPGKLLLVIEKFL